jgi:hypothetical protein
MITGCSHEKPPSVLDAKIKRFAPTPVTADLSHLSPGDRAALGKLVQAAELIDRIYTRQVWSGNEALRAKLEADKTTEGSDRLHYYNINRSPWSNLDHDEPFIPGGPEREACLRQLLPGGHDEAGIQRLGGFAPRGAEEGGDRDSSHDPAGRHTPAQGGPLQRRVQGPAGSGRGLLREAAGLTDNASLRNFLTKRADAFMSNDYYESDVAWMDLDSPIEPTIGPTRCTWTGSSIIRPHSKRSSASGTTRQRRSSGASRRTCRRSKMRSRSTPATGTRSWGPSPRSASSTKW